MEPVPGMSLSLATKCDANMTTANPANLHSPLSLSSGYCSDDDAAVCRGGDCWMPSTVVRQHKRRRRNQHRRPRHAAATDDSCLDLFPAYDPFALPPLQIGDDPGIGHYSNVDDNDDNDDDDVIVVSSHCGNDVDCCPAIGFRFDEIVDNWLFNSARAPSPPGDCDTYCSQRHLTDCSTNSDLPFADDINLDVDEATEDEQTSLRCGGSLLAELLLGLAVYRGVAPHSSKADARNAYAATGDENDKHETQTESNYERKCDTNSQDGEDRKLSNSSDTSVGSTAVKRAHNADGDDDKNTGPCDDESNANKVLKLGASCADSNLACCPAVVVSRDPRNQCIAVVNALVFPISSQAGVAAVGFLTTIPSPPAAVTSDSHVTSAGNVTSLPATDDGSSGSRGLVLEALLRSSAKLDANQGSDVASVIIKDGQPIVRLDSPETSSAASPAASADHSSGLLHRLLTGEVDEADVHRAAEAESMMMSASPSQPCDVLATNSLFDGIGVTDHQQVISPSVDDITATIGIQDGLMECYLNDI